MCGNFAGLVKTQSGVPQSWYNPIQPHREREFFIDNLLDRIHFIIVMIGWTGLAPWEFEFPSPGSLTSTFLDNPTCKQGCSSILEWISLRKSCTRDRLDDFEKGSSAKSRLLQGLVTCYQGPGARA